MPIVNKGYAKPDDPIYSTGLTVGGVRVPKQTKPLPKNTAETPSPSTNPVQDLRQASSPPHPQSPESPETEEEGIRAEAIRRLQVRQLFKGRKGQTKK